MANNRMYLVYRPTGDAVFLGKRYGPTMGNFSYGKTPDDLADRVNELFRLVAVHRMQNPDSPPDDFAIALEHGEKQPHAISNWKYVSNGGGLTNKIEISDLVPRGGWEDI